MWVVRAGREAVHFKNFEAGSYVAIGGTELANVSPETTEDELRRIIAAALPDAKPGSVSTWAAQDHRFANELAKDDEVVTYNLDEQTFLLGRIISPPELRPELPLPWVRRTRWTHRVNRDGLSEKTRNTLGAIQTLFRLNEGAAQELRQKAEVIVSEEDRARMAREVWDLCAKMLDGYPRRPPTLSADAEPVRLRRRLQTLLDALASVLVANHHWRAAASVGQGNWATRPWFAVYDSRATTSAQRGAYALGHFRTEGTALLLIGWGVSWTEYRADSQRRAAEIVKTLTDSERAALRGRQLHLAESANRATIPGDDDEGMIAAKLIPRSALNGDTTEITEDFRTILDTYKAWVDRTSTPAPAEAPSVKEPTVAPPTAKTYTLDWLADETQLNAEFLQDLVDALTTRTPQIILAGPPGTSKTWVAQKLSEYLTQGAADHQHIVQFHPSYSYEEFVEGLRPTTIEGAIQFHPVKGHLLRVVHGMDGRPARHVMILDEINRANLPRVLGELLYLLEYRDRPLDLQYSPGFRLPARLLFIGTMNTADRSIRSLDAALRRRFEVFECMPDPDVLRAYYENRANGVPDLVEGFAALNASLTKRLDRHHTVGHAFFMAEEMTPQRLLKVWKYKLGPLIDEYFFDQPDAAAEFAPQKFWTSLADLV
ncbi:MAG TPA: DUF3578 domain-containing protein [Vicinamibacterales bacterium]|jgi:hypothetical protein